MTDRVIAEQQPERLAARHAEFLRVDEVKKPALVEIDRALEVLAEVAPGHRQQLDLNVPGLRSDAHEVGEPAPSSLQRLEVRMMQDRIDVRVERTVDQRDQPVDPGERLASIGPRGRTAGRRHPIRGGRLRDPSGVRLQHGRISSAAGSGYARPCAARWSTPPIAATAASRRRRCRSRGVPGFPGPRPWPRGADSAPSSRRPRRRWR